MPKQRNLYFHTKAARALPRESRTLESYSTLADSILLDVSQKEREDFERETKTQRLRLGRTAQQAGRTVISRHH